MKKYPPGHKKYGKMGPLTKKEMDSIPMKNKDIKKLSSFVVGPSGHAYNPKRVAKMEKAKEEFNKRR